MEIFLLLIVLGLLIAIINHLSKNSRLVKDLQRDLENFKNDFNKAQLPATKQEEKPKVVSVAPQAPTIVDAQPEIKQTPAHAAPAQPKTPVMETSDHAVEAGIKPEKPAPVTDIKQPAYTPPPPVERTQGWFEKWLHDNPDIEKFIGENLINKIGIAVLVLGIAFFVKYAIDQEWINKVGRVCIGLFCGIILTALAHRLRKNYHSFSSVLVGGGLSVFYFTIAFAFHQYQLIGQGAAFVSMIIITAFAVLLSILYDRIELGILATIGGFITPFLVSNGEGNYVVLFSYLCILNVGLIILAYHKRWRILNFLAFVFTELIYIGWVFDRAGQTGFPYQGAFIFGIIFYIMFVVMNVIHHVSRGSKLKTFDFIVLLCVNLFFYGIGIYLLENWGMTQYKGLFTASLGIINLVLAYLFFRQSKADKNFIYLLIGITLTFISLTAPIQLKGHYITLFWAAEMVVLLWLYQKSFINLLKIASLLVSVLMTVSLIMDWSMIYGEMNSIRGVHLFPVIANNGFVTGLCSSIALFIMHILLRKEADSFFISGITNRLVRNIYLVTAIAAIFCTGFLEINEQFTKRLPDSGLHFVYLQLYVIAFFLLLFAILAKFNIKPDSKIRLLVPLLIFIFYVFNTSNIFYAERQALITGNNRVHFLANWLSVIIFLWMIWNAIQYVRNNRNIFSRIFTPFTWIAAIALLILFSVESRNVFVWLNYSGIPSIENTEKMYYKAGLTVVWALSSFIMIWLGMSHRYKTLRIIALVVFGITLVKLFAYDITNIAPAGKIIAFILLGVLLLIISFMYQRLKKIIIDDSPTQK
ncbi:MAG: DUF2339 domain-containing protein [Bacteroidetes bacterium]|nr:DUF2339 domain-containing protein [Bacteroidota bacterium]